MNKVRNKREAGFTLIEAIASLALGIALATIIVLVVTPGLRHVRETKSMERLHANAVFLSNTFAYWIKQAENLTVPTPSTLQIRMPDLTTKTITKDPSRILIDGNAFTSEDVQVTELTFTKMARSVRVNFQLASPTSGETLSITTTIAQRNSP